MGARRLYRDLSLNGLCRSAMLPRSARWRLLRAFGLEIPGWCSVAPGVWFGGTNITIGADSTISYGCFFDNAARIEIGAGCAIGMSVLFCTSTHEVGPPERRAGTIKTGPIVIGAGAWVGAQSVILPGVSVGQGCIIAASAVVTTDCAPDGLYAGVPARRVRDLTATGES